MSATKRRHPETNELTYQFLGSLRGGNGVASVYVCKDRIEVDESTVRASPTVGAAFESYEPVFHASFRRGAAGWPGAPLDWVRANLGADVAREVEKLIGDADAFRE